MIKLNVKGLGSFDKQEVEVLEFFLNTTKPIVKIDYDSYKRHKKLIRQYPFSYSLRTDDLNKSYISTVTIAKSRKLLNEYTEANQSENRFRPKKLGKLFGYPETAIQYFLNDNTYGERYAIKYYGLTFVCKRTELKKVEKELVAMYGLSLKSKNYTKEYF